MRNLEIFFMDYHFLPKEQNKAYSPMEIARLLKQAGEENNDDINAILRNKRKYKTLWEMYHGSFLALALYKKFGHEYQFDITEGQDPPDLYFVQKQGVGAFPVEVMELYKYNGNFRNYQELVQHIWDKKGKISYDKCHLLLASRLKAEKFNITEFIQKLKNYNWIFERIWLSIHTKEKSQWTFFEVFPPAKYNDSSYIYFNLKEDKKYLY